MENETRKVVISGTGGFEISQPFAPLFGGGGPLDSIAPAKKLYRDGRLIGEVVAIDYSGGEIVVTYIPEPNT